MVHTYSKTDRRKFYSFEKYMRRSSTSNKNLKKSTQNIFENEIGAQPPLGYWDPLGILEDADKKRFDKLREIEMKHGRVAMLAILGVIKLLKLLNIQKLI